MTEESKELTIYDLLDRTNKEKPKQEDVKALRRYLEEHPDAWRIVGEMAIQNCDRILENLTMTKAARVSIEHGLGVVRSDLGYDQSPMIEKILIDQLVLSKLHLDMTTNRYIQVAYDGETTITRAEFWEKRQSAALARFTRLTEALARVRKMRLPVMQVNIAQEGSQQLNVAGDLIKA